MITVRQYTDNDRQLIQQWIEDSQDYVMGLDPLNRLRRNPGYGKVFTQKLIDYVNDHNGMIFIAMDNKLPIGMAAGAIDIQTEENLLELIPTKVGTLSELYLVPEYRGKGVGKMLLEKFEKYLFDNGCDSMWLTVVDYNPAHQFYKKMGLVDREIGMIKKLASNQ